MRFLAARRWAVAVVLLLPVLAGAAAYSLLQDGPERHRAEVLVATPGGSATSATAIVIFVANYGLALQSPELATEVADVTGLDAGVVPDRIEHQRVGQSSQVRVSFIAGSRATAETGARSAALAALLQLAERERVLRAAALARAEADAAAAQVELATLQNRTGLLFPDREYDGVSDLLRSAELRLSRATALADVLGTAEATAEVSALRTRQRALVGPVRDLQALQARSGIVEESLADARTRLAEADAAVQPASAELQVGSVGSDVLSRQGTIVQGVALAAALALVLGLCVLIAPELLRRPTRRSVDDAPPSDPAMDPVSRVLTGLPGRPGQRE